MKKQQRMLVSALVAVICLAIPALAKSLPNKPLKTIAPDLIIETAEQGEFHDDPADPRHFKQSNVVGKQSGLFGWRMRVKTARKSILVQEKGVEKEQSNGLPIRRVPKYGYLFGAREIVQGVSPGKYSMTVYIENVPVKGFTWIVQ